MKTYDSSRNNVFINDLKENLNVEKLISTAQYRSGCDSTLGNINIYMCGTRGLPLLGSKINRDIPNAFNELSNVLKNLDKFKEEKITVKLRFLFVYPFSMHAYTRINAEINTMRSCTNDYGDYPDYYEKHPSYLFKPHIITEHDLLNSHLHVDQQSSIKCISDLLRDIHYSNENAYEFNNFNDLQKSIDYILPHKVDIRFTPLSISSFILIINKSAYIIPYLLGKDSRDDAYCTRYSPVTKVEIQENEISFKAIYDHYKYLWNRPHTLDFKDAFDEKENRFKMPHEIDFAHKKERIKQKIGSRISEKELERQRIIIESLLHNYCFIPPKKRGVNKLFIALSWTLLSDNTPEFGKDGKDVKTWLDEDFNEIKDILEIDIFKGKNLQPINDVFQSMMESSYGLVILSADLVCKENGNEFSIPKSNVSLELGYMMRQFANRSNHENIQRLLVVHEVGVDMNKVFSDLSGFINGPAPFKNGEIIIIYYDIINWIFEKIYIPVEVRKNAYINTINRIEKTIEDANIARAATGKIREAISSLTNKVK